MLKYFITLRRFLRWKLCKLNGFFLTVPILTGHKLFIIMDKIKEKKH